MGEKYHKPPQNPCGFAVLTFYSSSKEVGGRSCSKAPPTPSPEET